VADDNIRYRQPLRNKKPLFRKRRPKQQKSDVFIRFLYLDIAGFYSLNLVLDIYASYFSKFKALVNSRLSPVENTPQRNNKDLFYHF